MIRPQTKKAGAAFAGAVVLASGAYAVGSQNGDGSATAAGQNAAPGAAAAAGYGMPGNGQMRRAFREHRKEMFTGLAKQLGVKEADLRKAMREIREQQRKEFTKLLADKLGVSESKVEKAVPDRPKFKMRRFRGGPPPGAPGGPPGGPPPPQGP